MWELVICAMLMTGECVFDENATASMPFRRGHLNSEMCILSTDNNEALNWLEKKSDAEGADFWFVCIPKSLPKVKR